MPTIVDIYLDRPAVLPEINNHAKALVANFGASDEAILDVIFGKAKPEGKLPFELPSSMEAVKNQKEDVPYDSEAPLYKFGIWIKLLKSLRLMYLCYSFRNLNFKISIIEAKTRVIRFAKITGKSLTAIP